MIYPHCNPVLETFIIEKKKGWICICSFHFPAPPTANCLLMTFDISNWKKKGKERKTSHRTETKNSFWNLLQIGLIWLAQQCSSSNFEELCHWAHSLPPPSATTRTRTTKSAEKLSGNKHTHRPAAQAKYKNCKSTAFTSPAEWQLNPLGLDNWWWKGRKHSAWSCFQPETVCLSVSFYAQQLIKLTLGALNRENGKKERKIANQEKKDFPLWSARKLQNSCCCC